MKNKLSDLNDHLFAQLERLSEEDLTGDRLEQEIKRGEAVAAVADQIVRNASLQIAAAKLVAAHGAAVRPLLPLLEGRTIDAKPANGQAHPQ